MKFGVNLINRGEMATPENMARIAQRAEALGFDSITLSDHIVIPKATPSNYPYHPSGEFSWQAARNYYEPLATMAYLVGKTERIRLGTSVLILSYRNPIATAKTLASIDALSGGRIFLGVGTGWWEDEYKALGIGSHFAERGARTDEYLRIYKALWSEDEPAFEGEFHRFGNIEFSPKPARREGLPIWVGGHTRRALRRTVELGDVWHPIGLRPPANLDPAELGHLVEVLHGMAEKAGRDPERIGVAFRAPMLITDSESRPLTGSVQQIVDDIHSYAAKGVTHFTGDIPLNTPEEYIAQLERFSSEIMPSFA